MLMRRSASLYIILAPVFWVATSGQDVSLELLYQFGLGVKKKKTCLSFDTPAANQIVKLLVRKNMCLRLQSTLFPVPRPPY